MIMKKNSPSVRGRGLERSGERCCGTTPITLAHCQVKASQHLHDLAGKFLTPRLALRIAAAGDDPSLAASAMRTAVMWRRNVRGTESQRRAFVELLASLLELHTSHISRGYA